MATAARRPRRRRAARPTVAAAWVAMASTAPSPAPPDSPSRYGSASGLRIIAWSAAPQTARLPPTKNASSTRGARRSRTMTLPSRVRAARCRATPRRARAARCPRRARRRGRRPPAPEAAARGPRVITASRSRRASSRIAAGARGLGRLNSEPLDRQEAALTDRPHHLPLGPAGEAMPARRVVVRMRSGSRAATASMLTVPAVAVTSCEQVRPAGPLDQLARGSCPVRSSSAAAPRPAAAPWGGGRRRRDRGEASARVERRRHASRPRARARSAGRAAGRRARRRASASVLSRMAGDAERPQPARDRGVLRGVVEHDQIGTAREHRLDVGIDAVAEVGHPWRPRRDSRTTRCGPTTTAPGADGEQQLGGGGDERDDAAGGRRRAATVSPASSTTEVAAAAERSRRHGAGAGDSSRARRGARHAKPEMKDRPSSGPKTGGARQRRRGRHATDPPPRVHLVARTERSPGFGPSLAFPVAQWRVSEDVASAEAVPVTVAGPHRCCTGFRASPFANYRLSSAGQDVPVRLHRRQERRSSRALSARALRLVASPLVRRPSPPRARRNGRRARRWRRARSSRAPAAGPDAAGGRSAQAATARASATRGDQRGSAHQRRLPADAGEGHRDGAARRHGRPRPAAEAPALDDLAVGQRERRRRRPALPPPRPAR